MKKITYLLSIALFVSCGAPNENKEKNNVENKIQTQVAETEKIGRSLPLELSEIPWQK